MASANASLDSTVSIARQERVCTTVVRMADANILDACALKVGSEIHAPRAYVKLGVTVAEFAILTPPADPAVAILDTSVTRAKVGYRAREIHTLATGTESVSVQLAVAILDGSVTLVSSSC